MYMKNPKLCAHCLVIWTIVSFLNFRVASLFENYVNLQKSAFSSSICEFLLEDILQAQTAKN